MSFVKFLPSQHFSWYFNPQYLVSCCSDPYKTNYFLKEHNEVFQMNINRLLTYIDYLLKSTQSCKKCTIFRNLRTITQEEKKKVEIWPHFFHLLFEFSAVCIDKSCFKEYKLCFWKSFPSNDKMALKTDLITRFLIIFLVYDYTWFIKLFMFSDESLTRNVSVKLLKIIYSLLT